MDGCDSGVYRHPGAKNPVSKLIHKSSRRDNWRFTGGSFGVTVLPSICSLCPSLCCSRLWFFVAVHAQLLPMVFNVLRWDLCFLAFSVDLCSLLAHDAHSILQNAPVVLLVEPAVKFSVHRWSHGLYCLHLVGQCRWHLLIDFTPVLCHGYSCMYAGGVVPTCKVLWTSLWLFLWWWLLYVCGWYCDILRWHTPLWTSLWLFLWWWVVCALSWAPTFS